MVLGGLQMFSYCWNKLKDSIKQHINSGPPFTVYAMDPAFPEQIWEPLPLLQNIKRLLQRLETLVTISFPCCEKNYQFHRQRFHCWCHCTLARLGQGQK